MALYFSTVGLIDENGKVYLISNRVLLEECLKNISNQIKVSVIVFETITKLTGEKVIKRNYNQNKLFCWLENRIREDERYKTAKLKKMEECDKARKQKLDYKKNNMKSMLAEELLRYKRIKAMNYYRSKPKIKRSAGNGH